MGGQGIYPQACDEKTHRKPLRARLSYTFLKRHQGARSEARAGAPVGAKEVYSVPARVPCRSEGSVQRASPSPAGAQEVYSEPAAYTSKHLKNVQLTTQLC